MPVEASSSLEEVRTLADQDLVAACDQARSLVAANHDDADAALLLHQLVGELAGSGLVRPDREAGFSPQLLDAGRLLAQGKDEEAEVIVRAFAAQHPSNVLAMTLMAEIAGRCGAFDDARRILMRALAIDPRSIDALLGLAKLLGHVAFVSDSEDLAAEAFEVLEHARQIAPDNVKIPVLAASLLAGFRRISEAIRQYENVTRLDPLDRQAWMNLGLLQSTIGETGNAVASLRTANALSLGDGTAYWELANFKRSHLFAHDIALMREALDRLDPSSETAATWHFALSRAYEQEGNFEAAALHLKRGNASKSAANHYDPDRWTRDVSHSIETFDARFFSERKGAGSTSNEPIFVIGLQRSGTTLVEQILASHPLIEATDELIEMGTIAREVAELNPRQSWQVAVAETPAQHLSDLADRYLERTRRYRKGNRPYFIDKNPTNWWVLGLILTIFPKAKVVSLRRNPMDCCFANYAQLYGSGLAFSYSFKGVARFYQDYLRTVRHFQSAVPGRILDLVYEDLVDAPREQIGRLLDFVGVPHDDACLNFHETSRAVFTPSAQQVRQPMNRSGIGKWKPYEPWLGDLKDALGTTLTDWRD